MGREYAPPVSNRVTIPCTSYREAQAIADALKDVSERSLDHSNGQRFQDIAVSVYTPDKSFVIPLQQLLDAAEEAKEGMKGL